jgi:DNA-binding PadR family transcriptional regulator
MAGLPATDFESMEELIEKTRGPRARIIEALSFYDGRAHSQKVRNYGQIPSSTYHFDKLEEQGIIERDGTEYVSQGGSAIAYQLTDFGRDVADELEGAPETGADLDQLKEGMRRVISKVDEHTEEIQQLHRECDRLADHVGHEDARGDHDRREPSDASTQIAATVDEQAEQIEDLHQRVTALADYVGELDTQLSDYKGRNPNDDLD